MFNDEILKNRLKQIVFNLTVNRKNSSYRLNGIRGTSFSFICEKKDNNLYLDSINLNIGNYYECDDVKITNLEDLISRGDSDLLFNTRDYHEGDPKIILYILNKYYPIDLTRMEFAIIIKELQDMTTEYEDDITYEIQRLSETPLVEDSVEELDLKDPEA